MSTKRLTRRPLTILEILQWANAYRESTGKWPTSSSGAIAMTQFETWSGVSAALRSGTRGLPGGSSLAQLLAEKYGVRNEKRLPDLHLEQILEWADEHQERTGAWPTAKSGSIPGTGEKWKLIDVSLRMGGRGLPGGSSLARLLGEHRGVRNRKQLPPLTESQILVWADHHRQQNDAWPTAHSGPITDAPGETWLAADMALRNGLRGFPGGSSLAVLLAEKRNARNIKSLPDLSIEEILGWADAFHERTGSWPHIESGPIREAAGETWNAINIALSKGSRGLPAGLSLARLLGAERGVRSRPNLPRLTRKQILSWADAHRGRTGQWPTRASGLIPEAPGESWSAIDAALHQGHRGLREGSSLARFLAKYRNRHSHIGQVPLSMKKIVAWADAHYQHFGKWPNINSGQVLGAPQERWDLIDNALRQGHRNLRGGSSLTQLLARKRGVRNPLQLPKLTEEQIVDWARQHTERTGSEPKYNSGPVTTAPGETWDRIDSALRYGKRGLAAGSSLAKLLARQRQEGPAPIAAPR